MKILLVTLDSKFIHANLAVRYLKNFCSEDNHDIEIKEFTINQKEEYILYEILAAKADIICFSCYIWNIQYIKELAYVLKVSDNNTKILLGGPEVSFETKRFMEKEIYIDYIIFGEGELTFKEFLNKINLDTPDLKNIKGLAYRDNGKIIINVDRELINNLDVIKYPYGENENFDDKIIYYESSRGCPFSCSFCMSSIDKKMRNFSLKRVKEDLTKLLNTRARQIKFVDRTFNADYRRAMDIMEFIVENNKNNMTIHFEITVDIINEEFLDFLKKMPVNMFQFEIGVQSLNEPTLQEINRHMNIEKLNHVISRIRENNNIHMHLDLIAGLPYEGYDSFKISFDGVYKLKAEKIQLGFLKVLKGTKMYEDKEKHEIKYRIKAPYEVICTKYISVSALLKLKKVEELVDKYYNEKYFEKSLQYIIDKEYKYMPYNFYDDFSSYWQENNFYKVSHSRKKLYEILYKFINHKKLLTDELRGMITYDYVFNNQFEELPDYLDPDSEDKYKTLKRFISNDEAFRNIYFSNTKKGDKIINNFRIVDICGDTTLFIYENKKNIFNRCRVYNINQLIEEFKYE